MSSRFLRIPVFPSLAAFFPTGAFHPLLLEEDILDVTQRIAAVAESLNSFYQVDDTGMVEALASLGLSGLLDQSLGDVPVEDLMRDASPLENISRPNVFFAALFHYPERSITLNTGDDYRTRAGS